MQRIENSSTPPPGSMVPDILLQIFEYLTNGDLLTAASVCKIWSSFAVNMLWSARSVPLSALLLKLEPESTWVVGNTIYFGDGRHEPVSNGGCCSWHDTDASPLKLSDPPMEPSGNRSSSRRSYPSRGLSPGSISHHDLRRGRQPFASICRPSQAYTRDLQPTIPTLRSNHVTVHPTHAGRKLARPDGGPRSPVVEVRLIRPCRIRRSGRVRLQRID